MKLKHLLFSFLLLPISLIAHITGTYEVKGFDPEANADYTGTVVITKNGDVFTAHWTFDDQTTETGTGVLQKNSIAFVYNADQTSDFGVQLYEIHCRKLSGPWVPFEGTQKGFEKIRRLSVE